MMTNQIHTLLARWKNMKYIDHSIYKKLNVTDGLVPKSYRLPKIYKDDNPLRMIVSCDCQLFINSPLYPFFFYKRYH